MKRITALGAALWLQGVSLAMAQGGGGGGGGVTISIPNPIGGRTFIDVAKSVGDALTAFGIPILGIMIVWGGLQLITSGGAPDKISAGRKTLTYAVIGFAIILLAKEIPVAIQELLGS